MTLRRLERKGLLESWMGEPTEERGGKARRLVRVRPEGRRLLLDSRAAMDEMWKGLDVAQGDAS